jgi:isocitrate dehydrogenase
MVFISGEEMTHYAMNVIREKWVEPFLDTSKWEYYDLSCKSRDETNDQVLKDAVAAGARVGAIFKEPTITPTAEQRASMGLKNVLGSPNGAMRKAGTVARSLVIRSISRVLSSGSSALCSSSVTRLAASTEQGTKPLERVF